MSAFDEAYARIEAAMDVEDQRTARALYSELIPTSPQEQWRVETMQLFLSQPFDEDPVWARPIDEICIALRRLAFDDRAVEGERDRNFSTSLRTDIVRRRHDEALAQLDDWERANGASGRTVATRAEVLMAADDPEAARAVLTPVIDTYPTQHVAAALADLYYTVADFDEAQRLAETLVHGRFQLPGTLLKAAIAASRGDLQAEHDALTEAIAIAPNSPGLPGRLAQRALVAASLDRAADARVDFELALAAIPAQERADAAPYVRHRLDALDAAAAGAKHARLEAFPSIVQKWNYCGPAVIELCLRYAGVEMTQDLIAQAVKQPSGTPMVKIVEFLREQGFEVRRVEASAAGIRASIDAGVPLIVESAYSNSSHVSVAIGYDDRLGVLIMADPMTHAPSREGVEMRGDVAGSLRYGAVAVLGRADSVDQATRNALDAAGLVESAAVSRFDDIGRDAGEFSEAVSRLTSLEIAGIAHEVLANEPDFEAAAKVYAGATQAAAETWDDHAEAGRVITAMRARYPEQAEFAMMAARWYGATADTPFALADAVVAGALDRGAAEPRAFASERLLEMGQRALAYRYANAAFLRAPHEPGSTLDLASVTMRERLERARAEGLLGTFGVATTGARVEGDTVWNISDEVLAPLSRWHGSAAREMAPDHPVGYLSAGDDAALAGDWPAARGAYLAAVERADGWFAPRLRLAAALEATEPEQSLMHLRMLVEQAQLPHHVWAAVVEQAGRLGDLDLARSAALTALDTQEYAGPALTALFEATFVATKSEPQAARALVEMVGHRPGSDDLLHAAVDVLEASKLRGFAATLLREYLERAPNDARAMFRLAQIIARTPAEVAEAVSLLERARELAPWAEALSIELGWLLLIADPLRVRTILGSSPSGSLGALELSRRAAQLTGDTQGEDRARDGLLKLCGSDFYVQLQVARYHFNEGRVAEAMAVGLAGEPRVDDKEAVALWLRLLHETGRETRAVEFVANHPEFAASREVAPIVAFAGDFTHADIVVRAARVAADVNSVGRWAAVYAVEALCVEGRIDEAVAIAASDPLALARCSEWAHDAASRLALAQQAHAIAPDDRNTLAVWHSVLMDAGRTDEARVIATQMVRDFPYEHQAAERMAECELFAGDSDAAARWAETAVAEGPACPRALAARALAGAVAGDWELAAEFVTRLGAVARPFAFAVDSEPAGLVAAALIGDRAAYERTLIAVRSLAPGLPLERVTAACEERLAAPSQAS